MAVVVSAAGKRGCACARNGSAQVQAALDTKRESTSTARSRHAARCATSRARHTTLLPDAEGAVGAAAATPGAQPASSQAAAISGRVNATTCGSISSAHAASARHTIRFSTSLARSNTRSCRAAARET
ncbi:hypothetical protein EON68_01245 [archaeon]|nr:MAG: hypothetical protein EON68_01245 [archaeon]